MAAYSFSTVLENLRASQNKSMMERCLVMEDILRQTNTKDLKSTLPNILHEIFDFEKDESQGWQLDRISRSHNTQLFHQILHFMSPEGPLMNLINVIHADPHAVYQFPVRCLPEPSRNFIEDGAVPPFYTNKLRSQHLGVPVLMLNAFELFVFHLAYALVSPAWKSRNVGWGDLYDFIYPTIIDNFLVYLLPCDKSSLPSVPYAGIRPTISSSSPGRPYGVPAGQSPSPPLSNHSLFKSSFIQAQRQYQQSLPVFDLAETEIWRSETFLQILAEFWFNQNTLPGSDRMYVYSSRLQEHFMPTVNHIKMVRLLVKYLHYFANSASSAMTSSYQQPVLSPLDQFKRSVIPHILQKKLYTFLRHLFDHWPLDSCFRMVLEIWLSYIQPWRYTDMESRVAWGGGSSHQRRQQQQQQSEGESGKDVHDKWAQFVEDNLLFYTVLTRQFLPRVYRMDLTSPYSAYMVYRVSRILSLPNLANLIMRAEQKQFGGQVQHRQRDLGGSYLSNQTINVTFMHPSHMIELEGSHFQYLPFFSDSTRCNVIQVVTQLSDALSCVQEKLQQEMNNPKKEKKGGLWSFLFYFSDDEKMFSSHEYRRLPVHLQEAIIKFCFMFSIPRPAIVSQSDVNQSIESVNDSLYLSDSDNMSLDPECIQTKEGWQLTDVGRKQLINRVRKFDKFYVGEPDLQPVRSDEIASLVRLLFHLCSFINTYFSTEFTALYQRQDLTGNVARVFLTAPTSTQQIKNTNKSPISRQAAQLTRPAQARISLRFLASYKTIFNLSLLYLITYCTLGVGLLTFMLILFSAVCLGGFVIACFRLLRSWIRSATIQEPGTT